MVTQLIDRSYSITVEHLFESLRRRKRISPSLSSITTTERFVLSLSLCSSTSSKCFFEDSPTSPCQTNEPTGKSERLCPHKHLFKRKTSERTSALHSPPFSRGETVDSEDSSSMGVQWQSWQFREYEGNPQILTFVNSEQKHQSIRERDIGNRNRIHSSREYR